MHWALNGGSALTSSEVSITPMAISVLYSYALVEYNDHPAVKDIAYNLLLCLRRHAFRSSCLLCPAGAHMS